REKDGRVARAGALGDGNRLSREPEQRTGQGRNQGNRERGACWSSIPMPKSDAMGHSKAFRTADASAMPRPAGQVLRFACKPRAPPFVEMLPLLRPSGYDLLHCWVRGCA